MSAEGARAFFAAPYFAVVGASTNQAKFGYKIFAWYANRDLPATPINPGSASIPVDGKDYATLPSIKALPSPKETALSIITPPKVTIEILREAQALGIPAIWLQPGTFDETVLAFGEGKGQSQKPFKAFVAGDGGAGSEGWCVLVDGDKALRAVGKL